MLDTHTEVSEHARAVPIAPFAGRIEFRDVAFGYDDDLGAPAKLINEFIRATRLKLDVIGGLVEGRVFSPEQVKQLADLPSRETLIAQLMGTLQSPVAQLVGIMQTPLQQLLGTLEAYKTRLEAA